MLCSFNVEISPESKQLTHLTLQEQNKCLCDVTLWRSQELGLGVQLDIFA